MNNKAEFSKYEIAYAFQENNKEVEARIEKGRARIEKLALFRVVLDKARRGKRTMHCNKCGVLRTTAGDCLNTLRCAERQAVCRSLLQRYPFNVGQLSVTPRDIFLILHQRRLMVRTIKGFDETLNLRHVLHLSKGNAENLYQMPTII